MVLMIKSNCRAHHRIGMTRDLFSAASGENEKPLLRRIKVIFLRKCFFRCKELFFFGNKFHKWVPDKMHIHHSCISIYFFFEREDHQKFIYISNDLFDASCFPCPYLRAYIIDDPYATFLCLSRKTEIEAGVVNKKECVGTCFWIIK